jgi:hypothetical protein
MFEVKKIETENSKMTSTLSEFNTIFFYFGMSLFRLLAWSRKQKKSNGLKGCGRDGGWLLLDSTDRIR